MDGVQSVDNKSGIITEGFCFPGGSQPFRVGRPQFNNVSAIPVVVSAPHAACINVQTTTKLLINGEFRDSQSKEWIDVKNPVSAVCALPALLV